MIFIKINISVQVIRSEHTFSEHFLRFLFFLWAYLVFLREHSHRADILTSHHLSDLGPLAPHLVRTPPIILAKYDSDVREQTTI